MLKPVTERMVLSAAGERMDASESLPELLARVEAVDPVKARELRSRLSAGRGHRRVLGIIDQIRFEAARVLVKAA